MCQERNNHLTSIARYQLTEDLLFLMDDFSCGNEEIDNFFKKEAVHSCSQTTHIFVDADSDTVVAAVSLSCSALVILYDEGTACDCSPSVEITYFAVDSRYQKTPAPGDIGEGNISDIMMAQVFSLIYDFTDSTCAAENIILYSTPKAIHFYERNRFVRADTSQFWRKHSAYLDGCTFMYQAL